MGVPLKWKGQLSVWISFGLPSSTLHYMEEPALTPNILPPESEYRKWDQNFDDSVDTCFGTHR